MSYQVTDTGKNRPQLHSAQKAQKHLFPELPASHKSHTASSPSKGVGEKATLCKERQCIFQDEEKQQERLVGKIVTHLT